jgi:hypothetical protein
MRILVGHVMSDTAMVPRRPAVIGRPGGRWSMRSCRTSCWARMSCLSKVTKAVLERALAEEMTDHRGYKKHDPPAAGPGTAELRPLTWCSMFRCRPPRSR